MLKKSSIRLSDQPVAYVNFAKAVLGALVLLGVFTLSGEQVAGIVLAFEAGTGIFVWSSVTPNTKVEAKVAEAKESARNEALADVASLAG